MEEEEEEEGSQKMLFGVVGHVVECDKMALGKQYYLSNNIISSNRHMISCHFLPVSAIFSHVSGIFSHVSAIFSRVSAIFYDSREYSESLMLLTFPSNVATGCAKAHTITHMLC
jgi:hypothetical protein